MAKGKRKFKLGKLGRTIVTVIIVAVVLGVVGVAVILFNNDYRSIGANAFEVGSLSTIDGQHVKDDTAIYTKDVIECQGLRIKPEFDSDVTFQIFWYNEDELYINCTEKTTSPSAQFVNGVPALAKYCRIVIFPSQLDEEGKQIKDFEVSSWDIRSIVKNLNITVDKKQDFTVDNLFEDLEVYDETMGTRNEILLNGHKVIFENTIINSAMQGNLNEATMADSADGYDIIKIETKNVAVYKVDLIDGPAATCRFYAADGTFVSAVDLKADQVNYLEVPQADSNLIMVISLEKLSDTCSMTAYMPR